MTTSQSLKDWSQAPTRWDEMEHSSGLSTGMGTSLGIPNHSLELYKNENGVRKKNIGPT